MNGRSTRFPSPCRIDPWKGRARHHCSEAHADLVNSYREARYLQWRRAEQETAEYPTLLARYFGTDGEGPGVEVRVTFKRYLIASRRRDAQADRSAA